MTEPPSIDEHLATADRHKDAGVRLVRPTRMAPLKDMVIRVARLYTTEQAAFNGAVVAALQELRHAVTAVRADAEQRFRRWQAALASMEITTELLQDAVARVERTGLEPMVEDAFDVAVGGGDDLPVVVLGARRDSWPAIERAYGVTSDRAEADALAAAGHDVRHEDVVQHLTSAAPGSLGAVVVTAPLQRVSNERATAIVEEARRALAPGGTIVVDVRSADPAATQLLLERAGFTQVEPGGTAGQAVVGRR